MIARMRNRSHNGRSHTSEIHMKAIALFVALLFSVGAYASETTKINGKIVTTGMSVAEVAQRAGRADREVRLENNRGAAVGERWEYWQGSRMVSLIIQGGKVVRIDE